MFNQFLDLFRPKIVTVEQLATRIGVGKFGKLGTWLEWNIWYTPDKGKEDNWKPAQRTLDERKGDCEDFAGLAYAVLKLWGIKEVKLMSFAPFSGTVGHAICCFFSDGIWNYYTNGMFRKGDKDFNKMMQMAIDECKYTTTARIMENDIWGNRIISISK